MPIDVRRCHRESHRRTNARVPPVNMVSDIAGINDATLETVSTAAAAAAAVVDVVACVVVSTLVSRNASA